MDSVIEMGDIPVMRVRADMKGKGPPAAFELLESKLPSLKRRRFYGTFRKLMNGEEEYYACVEMIDGDNPQLMQLEPGLVPGGKYARRNLTGWEKIVREGRLPAVFQDLASSNEPYTDHDGVRPSLEFYRSQDELSIFIPLREDAPLEKAHAKSVAKS